ncbi:pilus assembly FimT family protein [Allofrancisella frigidaquae]|uniref:Type II secretion system protein H n=1 Tax=Allofrancisella frigidaquae TaxID=1085644 RepID=A0A6M3HSZ8_9GAMM|nr:GspH/FimT family pseudopilin [Allofrancisella frigidaquae]KEI34576.1 type IV fimbrial biogenesis protein FimT [Francisella sp. W12-1067]QIV94269.1 prepilin-type N-terminal cleavage/methylation domain-containing protein [Allofrancisella frigidaquae]
MPKQYIKKRGFSLVEVMVVIAIMTILMMAAISSFTFYYKTFAETRLTNLQKMIEFAVIKARVDGKTVVICAANADSFDATGKLDETTFNCANTDSWGDNPIVAFQSSDGTATYVANEDKIIANLPKGNNESLYINLSGNPSYLKISPNGFMATGNGNIVYCDKTNTYRAALILNLVGRVVYTDSPTKKNSNELYECN